MPEMSPEQELELLKLKAKAASMAQASPQPKGRFDALTAPDSYPQQIASGVNEGIANTLGAPVDLATGGINALTQGKIPASTPMFGALNQIGKLGIPALNPDEMVGGSKTFKDALGAMGAIAPPVDESQKGKRFARRVGQGVGEVAPFAAGGASSLAGAIKGLVYGAGSGVGGATAQQIAPNDPTAELIGSFVGGLSPALVDNMVSRMAASAGAKKAIPTSEQLKEMAGDLYTEAEKTGVTAAGQQTTKLHDRIHKIAEGEGLITPKSQEVVDTMPKVRAVMRMTEEFAGSPMTPTQMQAVRRSLQNAAKSTDGSEGRVGTQMLKEFDKYVEPLAPQFKEANGLYHRAMKAETLETARELAIANANKFTGSGFENALRQEYRKLDRAIVAGKLKGFTKTEHDAIKKVARGTLASNMARGVGKLAPTGAVSFAGGVGVPAYLGTTAGGPAVGLAVGASTAALGYGGRALATKLGIQATNTAELLVRAGAPAAQVRMMGAAQKEALAAALAAQGTNQAVNAAGPLNAPAAPIPE